MCVVGGLDQEHVVAVHVAEGGKRGDAAVVDLKNQLHN